nr:receptor-type tyrosine-protein phosphatase eta-like [Misgurnus anguillicaudatus]
MGEIHISNETETGANLSWSQAPGDITHYRVEVTANQIPTFKKILNETDLSTQLLDLKTGTQYDVQVIPVKCGRDLNPQNISFYTTPSRVYNLSVMMVTNESVELRWDHSGGYDFYSVNVSDVDSASTLVTDSTSINPVTDSTSTTPVTDSTSISPVTVSNRTTPVTVFEIHNAKEKNILISGLTPAKFYNFTVTAIVNGTIESVPESVSTYTKPSPVLNLTSADEYDTIINASWTKSNENLSGYRVCLYENNTFCSNCNDCSEFVNCTNTTAEWINFTGKTPDTKYILCVAALTNNNTVQGEMVQIDAHTREYGV